MKCQHCEVTLLKFNKSTKYCSNSCQHGAQNLIKKEAFLAGKFVGKHMDFKGWARELVFEIKGEQCEECGCGNQHNGKPLTLQIDHKDGNAKNNLIDNLRVLCPNCHTQTETFGAKNYRKSSRTDRKVSPSPRR